MERSRRAVRPARSHIDVAVLPVRDDAESSGKRTRDYGFAVLHAPDREAVATFLEEADLTSEGQSSIDPLMTLTTSSTSGQGSAGKNLA